MLSHRSDFDPDQIFSPFDLTRRPALIAAVSGGSDSLAMLLLLQRWLERREATPRLIAVTIDHQLRPESRLEAETVGRICAARGIAHRTLNWTGDKPSRGVSAAARLARYGLLSDAARSENSDIVVTGHTADDQAETVAMRQARGDGRGLAGMAPATLFDGQTWLVRPLLATRRDALRRFLTQNEVAWIDDPTNLDTTYERARMRRDLLCDPAGHRVGALLEAATRAGVAREALGGRAAALIEAHADRPMQGLVRLASDFAGGGDEEGALLALRALMAVVGGVEHLPDAGRVADMLRRLREGAFRATLSRTVIDARKTGVFLYRERRGAPAGPALPGTIWDGRYAVLEEDSAPNARVHGAPADQEVAGPSPTLPPSIVKAARATMPQSEGPNVRALPVLAPWRRFLPSFDVELAQTLARLIDAANFPNPPFAGHNGEEA
ncbi:tRNA lysidine(34) synthetase TilS [Arvimicrobium flavum]|uniref:tRNA lysidine(34) synthetase TilS n=1 Tax=Arvimicrobium flavum TaxID=3393320 RepID=UPI00237ABD13|nr:tRNA lysidine(34) synthetase TilS [Mesorhizobium shangrilense]